MRNQLAYFGGAGSSRSSVMTLVRMVRSRETSLAAPSVPAVAAACAGLGSSVTTTCTVEMNWYPRPGRVTMHRFSPGFSSNALRSTEMLCMRLFSSTEASGQTLFSSSSLESTLPGFRTK